MNSMIEFKNKMFVYSGERYYSRPSSVDVIVPEAFLTSSGISKSDVKVFKGSTNLFINATPPALSNYVYKRNYITLPVMTGSSITDSDGDIRIGDRLVADFINNNPTYGMIIGRC